MKQKIFFIIASLLVIFSLAACTCTTSPITAGTSAAVRTLSSSGVGEVTIVPDVAYIYVGVQVDADEVSDALAQNNLQANAVAEAVTALGVETKDVQTSSFNVYPMQEYDMNGQVSRKYYRVENTVYITVHDLTKMGSMLDAVVKAGANSINSISFDVQDKTAAVAEARDKAIQAAIAEAEAIAATTGVKLGTLQTVNVYTNDPGSVYETKMDMMGAGGSVPVSAGQIQITATANLIYEIK